MNSNDDDSRNKQADNNNLLLGGDPSDYESDFERLSSYGDCNNDALDIKSNESASDSRTEPVDNSKSTESSTGFGIIKKLRSFASMRKKKSVKKSKPRPKSDEEPTPIPVTCKVNNSEISITATESTQNTEGKLSVTPSPTGLKKKLSFQEKFVSFRRKDKERTPVQRSNTDVNRANAQQIRNSFLFVPKRNDSDDVVKQSTSNPLAEQECTQPIIEEFIETEESYIAKLWHGIGNYGQIFQRPDLPESLQGKEYVLLANIEEIAEFHRNQLLPMLLRHRENAKRIFMELQYFLEQKYFHVYVVYTINKQRSMQLVANNRSYFKSLEKEFDDRLGINSFLLQPIQRLARYPLLLTQFISTLFKHRSRESIVLMSTCCRLETKLRMLLTTINESECINDIVEVDVTNMYSTFRRVGSFEIYDHLRKRSYSGKLFMFDNCLILTKIVGKQLMYRKRYNCAYVQLIETDNGFSLFYRYGDCEEEKCDFIANPVQIELWLKLLYELIPVGPKDFSDAECLEEEGEDYSPHDYSKVSEFDIYDHTLERKYHARVYLFEKCVTYAEVIGQRVKLRGSYPFDNVGVLPSEGYFTLFYDKRNQQKCDFRAEPQLIKEWLDLIHGQLKSHFKRKLSIRVNTGSQ